MLCAHAPAALCGLRFAEALHAQYPGKLLAYNCSPSFNWKKKLSDEDIARFQQVGGNPKTHVRV